MTFAHILLGTARSPIASIATTLLYLPLFNISEMTNAGLALGGALGTTALGVLACLVTMTPRRTRRLHRSANYRLQVLCVGGVCAWLGRELVPLGECPSTALMILGGYVPLALGGVGGAQFVAAIAADGLRLAHLRPRASLCVTVGRRERFRRASR